MWEYMTVRADEKEAELTSYLSKLGSVGWEVVGVGSNDLKYGAYFTLFLKREVPGWPAPYPDTSEAWLQDLTGRFEKRYWNGIRWTEHVADRLGATSTDFPTK